MKLELKIVEKEIVLFSEEKSSNAVFTNYSACSCVSPPCEIRP